MAETVGALTDFRLPSLGSDMDVGTVLGWRVAVGDEVRRGDVVADVDTEKSEIEIEVWHDGVLAEILVEPGTEVPVGTVLARLAPPGSAVDAAAMPPESPPPVPVVTPTGPEAAAEPMLIPPAPVGRASGEALATPRTVYWPAPRAAASEASPDPATERAAGRTAPRGDRIQAVIADVMERANAEIPHYHLTATVDLTRSMAWLAEQNQARPVTERLLPAAVLIKAVADAVAEHSQLNGFWIDGGFRPADGVHVAVATHLRGGGLVSPAIVDADRLSIDELMAALRDLVTRARAGKLKGREMTAGSITVTNLGDSGADSVLGVIHPPQVALVGIGRVTQRPAAVDGEVAVRPTVSITLSADHRATNGSAGARFLSTTEKKLQNPEEL